MVKSRTTKVSSVVPQRQTLKVYYVDPLNNVSLSEKLQNLPFRRRKILNIQEVLKQL